MLQQRHFIILAGPTGVGKTDTSLKLAQSIPSEIINADIGQFYTPLTIGTAKPAWQTSTIPHHLFDILNTPEHMTVTQYRERVIDICNHSWNDNKIPIIVGGSHFYLSSLFFPPQIQTPIPDKTYTQPTDQLWHELHAIDSERAKAINKHDRYRIERALNIWHATGIKPSNFQPAYDPISSSYTIIFVTRDRDHVYQRINQRTRIMLNHGWVDEVQKLMGTPWEPFLLEKKIMGYDDIIHALRKSGPIDYDALAETIAQKTRHYAKRQFTYWRMLREKIQHANPNARIETLNLDHDDGTHFVEKLAAFVATLYTGQLKRNTE